MVIVNSLLRWDQMDNFFTFSPGWIFWSATCHSVTYPTRTDMDWTQYLPPPIENTNSNWTLNLLTIHLHLLAIGLSAHLRLDPTVLSQRGSFRL